MNRIWKMWSLAGVACVVMFGVLAVPQAKAQVSVTIAPGVSPQMNANAVLAFTATVTNDVGNAGVTWTLTTGQGNSKGAMSNKTTSSVTYTAPSTITSNHTATLTATSNANNAAVATATITLNTVAAKTALAGLVAMGDVTYTHQGGWPNNNLSEVFAFPGTFSGTVINVEWSQLEPSNGVFDFSAIDGTGAYAITPPQGQGLTALAYYNASNPAIHAEIRIHNDGTLTQPGTPGWVLSMDGGPALIDPDANGVMQNKVGAWWASDYHAAWIGLLNELAAYYDANPNLAEVTVESCSSEDAEPMHLATDLASLTNERALTVPYTDALATSCFQNAQNDYAVWHNTAVNYGLGLAFVSTDACKVAGDYPGCTSQVPTITTGIMSNFRTAFGARGAFGNQGLRIPVPSNQATIFAEYSNLKGPIEFQTLVTNAPYTNDNNGNVGVCQMLNEALPYNMTDMEMHQNKNAGGGGGENLTTLEMSALATQIATKNSTSMCQEPTQ